ncbi:acetyl-CoA carboxylase biotin carboxylase subunit [Salinisphaera dokdonensis CL-ES53]|uniref:Acetyl-CoA carboxylase biotin carboxylase subunit n=1 Tax=Salinisphaera dokdonensis CL-ES53 TaxID=1304272 RepID=A0ABV2AXP3_9GAMM
MTDSRGSVMTPFDRVLVANRGEIAVRIVRGARAVGCQSVAVYSAADTEALHVCEADSAVAIGGAPAADSYLSIERLIAAARASGAQAIHPGYGFLAENADFARAVEAAGLVFVGPGAEAIELMGRKREAKQRMIAAGVPCVPGYGGADQSDETLIVEGKRIGFPLMVKASAGGGGRGMRLVQREADLAEAIKGARSEASNAFGSDELILEKAVLGARHVEIQVLADHHGHVIHLGERDCSVQRRHQKVVEEAPSPAVDETLRARMGQAAVDAAAAIGYRGAGTVEFLLDATGDFYFMEMNTRLQVEHPVTEMITGLDLVAWQLRIAAGERLTLTQSDVQFDGHAIEVRLCLEDVAEDFMPQTGLVRAWRAPSGPGVRVDHGLFEGQTITPHYDSMAGKIIAWGETREIARRRLVAAVADTLLFGPTNNRDFLARILGHPVFVAGEANIGFVGDHMADATAAQAPTAEHRALAAAALHAHGTAEIAGRAGLAPELLDWRSANSNETPLTLEQAGERHELRLRGAGRRYEVCVDEVWIALELGRRRGTRLDYTLNGVARRADVLCRDNAVWLSAAGRTAVYTDVLRCPPDRSAGGGDGRIDARMDGRIQRVDVAVGDRVVAGDILLVLEAMKMEFSITADIDGVIESLGCAPGDQVAARQLLAVITPDNL